MSPASFALTSPDFADGGAIPRSSTCDGADRSPALAWSGAPPGTHAFALIVEDPDAGNFVHWVVISVPATESGLAGGLLPTDARVPQGPNSFGRMGYGGPCPPSGTHHYVFALYALSVAPSVSGRGSAADLRHAISGTVLGEAKLTGTYRRGG